MKEVGDEQPTTGSAKPSPEKRKPKPVPTRQLKVAISDVSVDSQGWPTRSRKSPETPTSPSTALATMLLGGDSPPNKRKRAAVKQHDKFTTPPRKDRGAEPLLSSRKDALTAKAATVADLVLLRKPAADVSKRPAGVSPMKGVKATKEVKPPKSDTENMSATWGMMWKTNATAAAYIQHVDDSSGKRVSLFNCTKKAASGAGLCHWKVNNAIFEFAKKQGLTRAELVQMRTTMFDLKTTDFNTMIENTEVCAEDQDVQEECDEEEDDPLAKDDCVDPLDEGSDISWLG